MEGLTLMQGNQGLVIDLEPLWLCNLQGFLLETVVNHFTGALLRNLPSTPFSLSALYMQRPASLSYWEVIVKLLGSILACALIDLLYSSKVNNLDTAIEMNMF